MPAIGLIGSGDDRFAISIPTPQNTVIAPTARSIHVNHAAYDRSLPHVGTDGVARHRPTTGSGHLSEDLNHLQPWFRAGDAARSPAPCGVDRSS
jgi:hypothetical protein